MFSEAYRGDVKWSKYLGARWWYTRLSDSSCAHVQGPRSAPTPHLQRGDFSSDKAGLQVSLSFSLSFYSSPLNFSVFANKIEKRGRGRRRRKKRKSRKKKKEGEEEQEREKGEVVEGEEEEKEEEGERHNQARKIIKRALTYLHLSLWDGAVIQEELHHQMNRKSVHRISPLLKKEDMGRYTGKWHSDWTLDLQIWGSQVQFLAPSMPKDNSGFSLLPFFVFISLNK